MNFRMNFTRSLGFGSLIYASGIILIGLVNLALGDFDPTQAVPASFPARTFLAYGASLFLVIAGCATAWPGTASRGALSLTFYELVIVTLLMNGVVVIGHYAEYGAYFGFVEGLALGVSALVVYARCAALDPTIAARLIRISRYIFGICELFFGGAHFIYVDNTMSLVPTTLPPSPLFWAYATGVFHLAAGMALLTNILARLAAILLTVMFASFTLLVHLPLLVSNPSKHFFWTENALNLALIGCAWIMADSLGISKFEANTPRRGD